MGQIVRLAGYIRDCAVHPHVRGADGADPPVASPAARFIPTCVGQMKIPGHCGAASAVHPHVRGADCAGAHMGRSAIGSSPRAWGRFVLPGRRVSSSRFIPTCVGQIRSSAVCSCARSVHPHVRGADSWCWSGGMAPAGSSPRAWGRFLHRRVNGLARRFIPTCVGQMAAGRTPPPPGSVHPHVRGADAGRWNWKQRAFGSSPRAWGRHPVGPERDS